MSARMGTPCVPTAPRIAALVVMSFPACSHTAISEAPDAGEAAVAFDAEAADAAPQAADAAPEVTAGSCAQTLDSYCATKSCIRSWSAAQVPSSWCSVLLVPPPTVLVCGDASPVSSVQLWGDPGFIFDYESGSLVAVFEYINGGGCDAGCVAGPVGGPPSSPCAPSPCSATQAPCATDAGTAD